ncbi:MAG: cytochrome c [Deltaproteobacteria bacterium]|nr:cytochrome c [Deltaproteobacteria bacterium]
MKNSNFLFILIFVFSLSLFSLGCEKKEKEEVPIKTQSIKPKVDTKAEVEYTDGVPKYKARKIIVPPRPKSVRLDFTTNNPLPKKYREIKTNPIIANQKNLDKGAKLYQSLCSTCHGAKAKGDGAAGEGLTPRPTDLYSLVIQPEATVGYLMWAITDGGKPFKSAMPSYKKLSKKKKQLLILHLRSMY